MAFSSKIAEQESSVVFHLSGKLISETDAIDLNILVDAKLNEGKHFLIFDLSQLKHCNSSGLNVFVRSLTKSRVNNGDTFLVNPYSDLLALFKIMRIQEIFNIYSSLSEVEEIIQSYKK